MSPFSRGIAVTYLGHATLLLELAGRKILTDPLLCARFGPIRRVCPLPDLTALGRLDAVLISHLHHDHLDLPSLRRLAGGFRLIVPRGAGRLLTRAGFGDVVELARGDALSLGETSIRAVHADHSGLRLPFGPRAEAIGYVIESPPGSAYFAGDTRVFAGMAGLQRPLDIALLPVWGWGPHLRGGHMDPREAARAVRLLRPRFAIPVHWGTYWPVALQRYRGSRLRAPGEEFRRRVQETAPETRPVILQPGGRWEMEA